VKLKRILLALAGVAVIALLLNLARSQDSTAVPVEELVNTVANRIAQMSESEQRETMPDSFEMKDALPMEDGSKSQTEDVMNQPQDSDSSDKHNIKQPIKIVQSETAEDENGNKVEMLADVENVMWGKVNSNSASLNGSSTYKKSENTTSSSNEDTNNVSETEPQLETEKESESQQEQESSGTGDIEPDGVKIPDTLDDYNKLTMKEEVALTTKFSSVAEYNAFINNLRKEDNIAKGVKDGSNNQNVK